jgi:hypothetical protein
MDLPCCSRGTQRSGAVSTLLKTEYLRGGFGHKGFPGLAAMAKGR